MKLGILVSTSGTDMQAIIDSGRDIAVVIGNKECYALERAEKHGIKNVLIESKGKGREEFDKEVAKVLEDNGVELILLIGYMRYLSEWFVDKYRNKIMNIHPSLLPAFGGGMDKDVHKEILDHGCKVTGCTLHFVDEGADTGPIILQKAVQISEDETVESLKEKVQEAEAMVILKAIKLFEEGKLKVEGRKVRIL